MRDRNTSGTTLAEPATAADGTNVLFELWRLSRAAAALLVAPLATTGLSGDEFGVYSVLDASGPMSPTALARWMSARPTTVSSHLKRLEARGHLVRRPDPADGRGTVIELTAAGTAAHRAATAVYLPILAAVQDRLGDAEPGVLDALVALRTAVDETAATDG